MEEKGIDGEALLANVQSYTAEFKGMDYTPADWWGDDWMNNAQTRWLVSL